MLSVGGTTECTHIVVRIILTLCLCHEVWCESETLHIPIGFITKWRWVVMLQLF
jgi:hypothetical protein